MGAFNDAVRAKRHAGFVNALDVIRSRANGALLQSWVGVGPMPEETALGDIIELCEEALLDTASKEKA